MLLCPNCQAVLKELWIDKRSSELMDANYFHIVFTIPHIHCIVSGGGLTKTLDLKLCKNAFFIRMEPLVKKFRGKFLYHLNLLYQKNELHFSKPCQRLRNRYVWSDFRDKLYQKDWNAQIKETFNGHGNAIEYLGRYANRIAITNTRIQQVTETEVTFSAKDYKTGEKKYVTITYEEFIRRFMMHVLPSAFQKIRYYGYLNNRWKNRNLSIIFRIQGHRRFQTMLSGLSMDEILQRVWNYSIHICSECGCNSMRHCGRTFFMID